MQMLTCPKLLAFKQLLKINIVDRRIQEKMLVSWVQGHNFGSCSELNWVFFGLYRLFGLYSPFRFVSPLYRLRFVSFLFFVFVLDKLSVLLKDHLYRKGVWTRVGLMVNKQTTEFRNQVSTTQSHSITLLKLLR